MNSLDLHSPSPALRAISAPRPPRLIKPRGFRPARQVQRAEFLIDGPVGFSRGGRKTPSQKRGKKYEAQVLQVLEALECFKLFTPSPWIEFDEPQTAGRLCQPDAIGFWDAKEGPTALLFEVKLRHNIMAYWQLRCLYEPVVRRMFPEYRILVCEVTRAFDPSTPWPEDITLCYNFDDLLELPATSFGVLQWRP